MNLDILKRLLAMAVLNEGERDGVSSKKRKQMIE